MYFIGEFFKIIAYSQKILKKEELEELDINHIRNYIEEMYREKETTIRKKFQEETALKDFIPVVDDDVARYLKLMVRILKAKKILEIGTSIGYSTVSMASIVKEWGGTVTTIEYDEKVAKQAKENFIRTGVSEAVEIIIGDAREIVPNLNQEFDLIFQDVDKRLYPLLLEDCINLLKTGGVLVAEDTLFPVIDLDQKWHHLIPPIEEFNRLVAGDERLESTILPIGDGVTVAIKS